MSESIVKNLSFGEEGRVKVFEGITKLTQAVSSTLGASGKCVMLEDSSGKPVITKDGVTVANSVILLDPVENMGATLLKEAARQTVKEAGDGTTTATVLAHSILKQAFEFDDYGSREIRDGISSAVDKVIKYLEKESKDVSGDMLYQVATISSNNDSELGGIIAKTFEDVGENGVVSMEISNDEKTTSQVVNGTSIDKGLKNLHFVNNKEKGICELNNPLVLVVESKIPNVRKIQSVLEYVIKNKKELLIVGEADDQVTTAIAMNVVKGNIKANIIDSPDFGINRKQILQDIALLTGATVINEDLGDDIDLIDIEHLGTCIKATTDSDETIIQVEEGNKEVEELIENVKKQIEETNSNAKKHQLERRLSRLAGRVGVVKVGANSEVELKEKADRVEDAICATKAAVKEGILPGGGIALLNASSKIKGSNRGEELLLEAIKAPFKTIMDNAGIVEYDEFKRKGFGFNVVDGKEVDMIKAGIVDPLLVTKSALKNAASVANTILSTDCVINNLRVQ
uniref:Chaperonin GroEL n=1 Tax=uncultured virus TaxID=340016 RepID=A0A240F7C3_9VIRU|nr:chaperonin GroEL [uncultured virus]